MASSEIQNVKEKATVFVIFGATGDLSQKKLFPSLYRLFKNNILPDNLKIVAAARSQHTTESFSKELERYIEKKDSDSWKQFISHIKYHQSDIAEDQNLDTLANLLDSFEKEAGVCVIRIYYLAVAPQIYEKAFNNLGKRKLHLGCRLHDKKARIIIEKPFGYDLYSAQNLQQTLSKYFSEEQTYRIDHLLGKETVQNIMAFRFANEVFSPIWNGDYIDHVQINYAEHIGIEGRGEYYDKTGALRDMVQNHLLRLLSTATMNTPKAYNHTEIRKQRVEIIKSIHKMSPDDVGKCTVRGQYEGYLSEKDVAKNSKTETFTALRIHLENERWKGVPFYLRTGKKLTGKVTSIIFQLKERGHKVYKEFWNQPIPNHITLQIQPNEGIGIHIAAKKPGLTTELEPVNMEFCYKNTFDSPNPDAYERLLMDVILGDQTLFLGRVEESWKFIDPIRNTWDNDKPKLEIYQPGSWGPQGAEDLIKRDGREWLSPILTICKI